MVNYVISEFKKTHLCKKNLLMIGCPNDDSDEFENTEIYSKADVSKASEL